MEAQEVLFDEPAEAEATPVQATALAKHEPATTAVAAPQSETAALLSMLQSLVTNESVSIERVNQAFDFYQRVDADRARRSYDAAFAAMQPELPIIDRKGKGRDNIKYGRWEDIVDGINPILGKHGFALSFRVKPMQNAVDVTAILSHRDGHREETNFPYPFDKSGGKPDIHAIASATSYGKRYTGSAILNLVTRGEDDDANAAAGDPLATIDEKQQAQIKQLLKDTGSDTGRFLAWAGAEMVSDILASKFDEAVKMLNAKKKGASK